MSGAPIQGAAKARAVYIIVFCVIFQGVCANTGGDQVPRNVCARYTAVCATRLAQCAVKVFTYRIDLRNRHTF